MTEIPVNSKDIDYHLAEFRIVKDPANPRRIVPAIPSHFRRVLEVGCGAAGTLSACEVSEVAFLCGVDVDHSALQVGQRLVPGIHFIRARGEYLPLSSEAFEFVIARVSLPYMDTPRALREIARILKPGGSCGLCPKVGPERVYFSILSSA
jgi:ubiquinone/menaquinone biosynthesis C-methylase UbiE